MNHSKDNAMSFDAQLAQRFHALKRSEAAELPAAPTAQELAQRQEQSQPGWITRPASALALAASLLVAVVVLWQAPGQQPDAGVMYADIMAGASFTTDVFLATSHGIAPESVVTPGVFDVSIGLGEAVQ